MDKQLLTMTDAAVEKVKALMAKSPEPIEGIRIGVRAGGCSGMSYYIDYAKSANPGEQVVEQKGIKIFVEPASLMYLIGTEMDYKSDKLQSGFSFTNPNEKGRCGCGQSFKVN